MTLPNLTSTTAQLRVYLDALKQEIVDQERAAQMAESRRRHASNLACEVLDELNRRESCPHEDFTENLEGRKCRECGLETK